MQRAYDMLLPLARAGVRLASPLRPKLAVGLAGRRGLQVRLAALGREHGGRLVWIHSASVGEYEQARPIAALARARRPDLEILHTFFSPSGYEYARRLGEARHFDYLPEDTRPEVGRALEALRPRALVFMKFDVWPNLVFEASRRHVPLLLLDATLQPRSWRSRAPARGLYRELYRRLDVISAVSEADAARFRALVPSHRGIHADGDTRFDQVMRRRREARRVPLAGALLTSPRPFTLIAGSTWPPDETRLLAAWRALRDAAADAAPRLVLVPHEPTPAHLAQLEAALVRHGLDSRRYSQVEMRSALDAPVVLVDRVGILAELYAVADVAYVGGAFTTGVHNLMEPAIAGLPLLFGPRHHNAPEADLFLEAGAAGVVRSALDLHRQLETYARDADSRRQAGSRARACVEANLGAATRCWERLAAILTEPAARAEESTA